MTERISRVLTNDPGIGVARHADAGYELARELPNEKAFRFRWMQANLSKEYRS
ncbi:MAG: hypothetical protein CM1200mP14_24010 [Gammaproteobacteria bacterium]|nr:MAG: hypothetical protein CM1200mP14_24010 [Gammaproteobacteria bacterium]